MGWGLIVIILLEPAERWGEYDPPYLSANGLTPLKGFTTNAPKGDYHERLNASDERVERWGEYDPPYILGGRLGTEIASSAPAAMADSAKRSSPQRCLRG